MQKLILATNNQGKIKELNSMLSPIECIAQKELNISSAVETGATFIENAILKARHVSQESKLPSLADDSGLVIPELDGQPGIYSARFAGNNASDVDNINLVLQRIREKGLQNPAAYFYCAIVLMRHPADPTPLVATGKLCGVITSTPTGKNGFGYDPIFYLPKLAVTLAEVNQAQKNSISHRAQALQELRKKLNP